MNQSESQTVLIMAPIASGMSICVHVFVSQIGAFVYEQGRAVLTNVNWEPTMRTREQYVRIAFNEFITRAGLPDFSVDMFPRAESDCFQCKYYRYLITNIRDSANHMQ